MNNPSPQNNSDAAIVIQGTTLLHDEEPVRRFVSQVIVDAVARKASDIHFEPYENDYRIRIRCDGILLDYDTPPAHLAQRFSSIIKILAKLDISENRLPQDGRILMKLNTASAIDIRVSVLPCLWGEKLVLRLLNSQVVNCDIDSLGLNPEQKELFLSTINKPQGMVLITGPTGSGKTATLYTALGILNTPQRNISTAEDPIERSIYGINQVQIHEKIGLNFAKALRTFLRQDPDVIMLGEIRDKETASIAIKSAQTGHLVLSTLHTNSAVESLVRLKNMGIESYNISGSLSLIVAQRLIRKLCVHCRIAYLQPKSEAEVTGLAENITVYKSSPDGCAQCNNGFQGRTGIFELLPITESLQQAIQNNSSSSQLSAISALQGITDLKQAACRVFRAGVTSYKEIERVIDFREE